RGRRELDRVGEAALVAHVHRRGRGVARLQREVRPRADADAWQGDGRRELLDFEATHVVARRERHARQLGVSRIHGGGDGDLYDDIGRRAGGQGAGVRGPVTVRVGQRCDAVRLIEGNGPTVGTRGDRRIEGVRSGDADVLHVDVVGDDVVR